MKHRMATMLSLALGMAICLSLQATGALQDANRIDPPSRETVRESEKLIRDVFREEYAVRTEEGKRALSGRLLKEALASDADAASQFVLLSEASRLATEAGDLSAAFEAIAQLSKRFVVNAVELKGEALSAVKGKSRTKEEYLVVARGYLELSQEAVEAEEFDSGRRAADQAASMARRGKDMGLYSKARAFGKEVSRRSAAFRDVERALETLKAKPDDEKANLVAGRYRCFTKGDWEGGLPLLAKGSDKDLAKLAAADLAFPADAPVVAAVADGWWKAGQEMEGETAERVFARAVEYYEEALPDLAGLAKLKIEKRLLEWRESRLGAPELFLNVDDPKQFGLTGVVGEPFRIDPGTKSVKGSDLTGVPGNFDGFMARVSFDEGSRAHGGIRVDDPEWMTYIDNGWPGFLVAHLEGQDASRRWIKDFQIRLDARREYQLAIILEEGEYVFYLDGIERCRKPTRAKKLTYIGLQASHGPAIFDRVRLRKMK